MTDDMRVRFAVRGTVLPVSEHVATLTAEDVRRIRPDGNRHAVPLADAIERVLVGEDVDPIRVTYEQAWPLYRILDVALIVPPRDEEALALHEAVRSWLEDEGQVSGGRIPRE